MKVANSLSYLATGESYTSLSFQFMVGRSSISKFVPKDCREIQEEFKGEYLRCPSTPDDWKELEQEFRYRWNVPHAVGTLDGKHVALKKPNTTGALYYNNKGLFPIVMLALVDGQYKFKWVDADTAGSSAEGKDWGWIHRVQMSPTSSWWMTLCPKDLAYETMEGEC